MAFDTSKYERAKSECSYNIEKKNKTAFDYMHIYKQAIVAEDYEKAKAITEVLAPLKYHTADTHPHIKALQ